MAVCSLCVPVLFHITGSEEAKTPTVYVIEASLKNCWGLVELNKVVCTFHIYISLVLAASIMLYLSPVLYMNYASSILHLYEYGDYASSSSVSG